MLLVPFAPVEGNFRGKTLTVYRYYNLATDFYEYGFGQSFHFGRPAIGESFQQSIIRHEHYLAHMIDIKEGMKVLDVGCGVGGPAREIAKFTGAYITGLNLNEYQVERATRYTKKSMMDRQVQFVQGNFMVSPDRRCWEHDDLTFELFLEHSLRGQHIRRSICDRGNCPRAFFERRVRRNISCSEAGREVWRV